MEFARLQFTFTQYFDTHIEGYQVTGVDWLLILWCLMPFSTVYHLYRSGLCTFPCFSGVLLTNTRYSFQATSCFPTFPVVKQWTAVAEQWILSQWLSSILWKNIVQPGDQTSNLLFSGPVRYWLNYGAWYVKSISYTDIQICLSFLSQEKSIFSIPMSSNRVKCGFHCPKGTLSAYSQTYQ